MLHYVTNIVHYEDVDTMASKTVQHPPVRRLRTMKAHWETWSPFQSPEVRDICAHMTDAEIAKASARSGAYGLWSAVTFALPLAVAFTSRSLGVSVCAVVLVAVHLVCIPIWQKKQKRFLCSTDWARERGIKPDRLRMFAFRG
ncbi:MAG: hypothetical protein NTY98_03285 [Verrucomicrobia bacterium]|nr:hypothetical protein [Verrucomicrobiota bacterium]